MFASLFLAYFTPSLGPPTSLQMARFHSFYGWIFHCIYVPHLYLILCWWTLRLLPCPGYRKQCCSEHRGACLFWTMFSPGTSPGIGLLGHTDDSFAVQQKHHIAEHWALEPSRAHSEPWHQHSDWLCDLGKVLTLTLPINKTRLLKGPTS